MAEGTIPSADTLETNPQLELIADDIRNRQKWAKIDAEIVKKRLAERPARKTKPYPNAPNFVVPIVDDVTREKTNQEMNMIHGAARYAHFIPLDPNMPAADRNKAEVAFDTYLRHVIRAAPKIEEANDIKNCRGFVPIKIFRTKDARFGIVPDFAACDPRDVIVPPTTRPIGRAGRITNIYRYTEDEFLEAGEDNGWENVTAVAEAALAADRSKTVAGNDVQDTFELVKNLIGLSTDGESAKTIVVFEHWHFATDWDLTKDTTGRLVKGQKCCTVFSPQAPEMLLKIFPWREEDQTVDLTPEEFSAETGAALKENRAPVKFKTVKGADRGWPFVQARYENRSSYYYDTRGVGYLCLDDQIAATALLNGKMTMVDYFQLPLFEGAGSRASTNVKFDPGSFLPEGVKAVQMPAVPAQFDFDIDGFKRTSARRAGAMSQYQFSEQLSVNRKVQKTATEVQEESVRGTMISNADVDRFNGPFAELYQQLWEDLARLKTQLPMIETGAMKGMAGPEIYRWKVLVTAASNAKTWNPDLQFQRAVSAWSVVEGAIQYGLTVNVQEVFQDILGDWDPIKVQRWLFDPNKPQGGLPPVYAMLQQLQQMMQQMQGAVEATGKMAMEDNKKLEAVAGGKNAGMRAET